MDASFKLGDLLRLGLHNCVDACTEIVDRAQKELLVEKVGELGREGPYGGGGHLGGRMGRHMAERATVFDEEGRAACCATSELLLCGSPSGCPCLPLPCLRHCCPPLPSAGLAQD